MPGLDIEAVSRHIMETLAGVERQVASKADGAPEIAWGDHFYFYDPDRVLEPTRKFPFATIVIKDYPGFDEASNLNRPGIYRLNIGVSRPTFDRLFEPDATHDFTQLDRLIPHPVYAKNRWVSVLNPSQSTLESLQPLLVEAHGIARARYERRVQPA
jgi:Family of unknown function (DUF6194)